MSAYVVLIRERTTDPDALQRYRELAALARKTLPLTPLAFYGLHDALEGEAAEGVAILSFPSMAAARAWYGSLQYKPRWLTGSNVASLASCLWRGATNPKRAARRPNRTRSPFITI